VIIQQLRAHPIDGNLQIDVRNLFSEDTLPNGDCILALALVHHLYLTQHFVAETSWGFSIFLATLAGGIGPWVGEPKTRRARSCSHRIFMAGPLSAKTRHSIPKYASRLLVGFGSPCANCGQHQLREWAGSVLVGSSRNALDASGTGASDSLTARRSLDETDSQ
jgi:hypothetical protein